MAGGAGSGIPHPEESARRGASSPVAGDGPVEAPGRIARLTGERQLGRMRGMTALHHRRFLADVWLTLLTWLGLFVAGDLGTGRVFVALPFVALFGAVLTAFDASYLIFARHYAAALERYLNRGLGETVLVAAELEDAYLFRLRDRKVVTIGRHFTWFGFVTAFFTLLGVGGYALGVQLGLEALDGQPATGLFLGALAALTAAALGTGLWWFVAGTGERRLTGILDARFPLE